VVNEQATIGEQRQIFFPEIDSGTVSPPLAGCNQKHSWAVKRAQASKHHIRM